MTRYKLLVTKTVLGIAFFPYQNQALFHKFFVTFILIESFPLKIKDYDFIQSPQCI